MMSSILSATCRALLAAAFFLFAIGAPLPINPLTSEAQAQSRPASCGREGQRPCTVLEFVPSCASGLVERPLGQRCSRPSDNQPLVSIQKPANCGAQGQRPCPLPYTPSCDAGLVENFASGTCISSSRPAHCGREGQKPCTVAEFFPSCEGRLVEDFSANACIRNDGDIVNIARNTLDEAGAFIESALSLMTQCGVTSLMFNADDMDERAVLDRLSNMQCVTTLLAQADRLGYQTVTIGGAGGASFLIGGDGESGFAFDTKGRYPPSTYHTLGFKIGFTAGGGAAVTLGFFKKTNQPGSGGFGGDAHGATLGLAAGGGSGGGVWYEYDGALAGVSGFVTAGGSFDAVYVRNHTEIISLGYVAPTPAPQSAPQSAPQYAPRPDPYSGGAPQFPAYPDQPGYGGGYQEEDSEVAQWVGLATALLSLVPQPTETVVRACNQSSHEMIDIYAAHLEPAWGDQPAHWLMNGRYQTRRGECSNMVFPPDAYGNLYSDNVYFYAKAGAFGDPDLVEWSGEDASFCIADQRIEYHGADRMPCDQPGQRRVNVIEYTARPGEASFTFEE